MIAKNYQKYKINYKILAVVLCVLLIIPIFGGLNIAKASSTGISIIPDSFHYNYVDGSEYTNLLPVNDPWTIIAKGLSYLANIGDVSYTNTTVDCISGVMQGPCGVPLVYETYEFTVPADGTYRVAVNSYAEASGKFAYTLFDISGSQPETVASNGTSALSTIDNFRHAVDVELLAGHTYGFYQFYFRFGLLPGQRITFSLTNSIAPVVDNVPAEDVSASPYLVLNNVDENGVITWDICGVVNSTNKDLAFVIDRTYTNNIISFRVAPQPDVNLNNGSYLISSINLDKLFAPVDGNYLIITNYDNISCIKDGNYNSLYLGYYPHSATDNSNSYIQSIYLSDTTIRSMQKYYTSNDEPVYYNIISGSPLRIRNHLGTLYKKLGAGLHSIDKASYTSCDLSWQVKCIPSSTTNNIYELYNISYDSTTNIYSNYNYASDSYYEEINYTTNEAGDTYYVTDNSGQQIDCDSITIINEGDTYNITYNYITNGGSGGDGGDGGDGDDGGLLNWIKERILNGLGSLFDEVTDFLASILGDLLNLIWKIIKGFLGIFTDILADAPAKIDDFFGAFNPNNESNIFDFWDITELEPNYVPSGGVQ